MRFGNQALIRPVPPKDRHDFYLDLTFFRPIPESSYACFMRSPIVSGPFVHLKDQDMQNQIETFIANLQNTATEYSDPTVILQHMPIVKDHLDTLEPLLAHWQFALAGLIGLIFARRILKKRKKASIKPTSMVMPPPYYGEDSTLGETHPLNAEDTPSETALRLPKRKQSGKDSNGAIDRLAGMVSPRQPSEARAAAPAKRSTEDQLRDVSAVSFAARPVLTANEARTRVMLQAALTDLKAPLMIMARTSLAAIVEPGIEAVGPERANALAALDGKTLDFGVFDRAGRLVLSATVASDQGTTPAATAERAVVSAVLTQAGVPSIELSPAHTPAEIAMKIAPFIGGTIQPGQSAQAPTPSGGKAPRPDRHVRPARPGRPGRPSAIAAE